MYNCHMAEIDYDDLARQLRVFFGKNRTQKAVKHVVRTTLYDAGITTVQADDDTELAHLCTMLVLSHPRVHDKYADGLPVEYHIGRSEHGWATIMTVDPHGTEDDFSWIKAAENASRIMKSSTSQRKEKLQIVQQRNHYNNVIDAMRLEIQDQIDGFREDYAIEHGGMYVSAITGKALHAGDVHVDHHPLDFADIVNGWLTQQRLSLSDVVIKNNVGSFRGHCMSDSKQKESWSNYHRDVAQLRIISAQENWRKGRTKVIRPTV